MNILIMLYIQWVAGTIVHCLGTWLTWFKHNHFSLIFINICKKFFLCVVCLAAMNVQPYYVMSHSCNLNNENSNSSNPFLLFCESKCKGAHHTHKVYPNVDNTTKQFCVSTLLCFTLRQTQGIPFTFFTISFIITTITTFF